MEKGASFFGLFFFKKSWMSLSLFSLPLAFSLPLELFLFARHCDLDCFCLADRERSFLFRDFGLDLLALLSELVLDFRSE